MTSDRPSRRLLTNLGLALALVVAVTFWLHWPAVHNGFVRWDDDLFLRQIAAQQKFSLHSLQWAFTALELGGYYALAWLSQLFDYQVWGLNPAGHHAHSVVLHAVNVAVVFWFVWLLSARLPGNLRDGERLALATTVSLVFGIHPLQVESVAWMAERRTVLCGTFMVAALAAYLKSVEHPDSAGWRWGTITLTAAALATKPMAVSLPVVMLILDWYPLRRTQTEGWLRLFREKLVVVALTGLLCVVTVVAQVHLGTIMPAEQLSWLQRGYVAVRGVVFYLWKVLWPAWLSPFYPMEGSIIFRQADVLVSTLIFVVITAVAVAGRRRWPSLAATWLAFLVLLLPMSGLVQVGGQAAADRYMYVTMLPLFLLVAGSALELWRRVRSAGRVALAVLVGCYGLFLGYSTRAQIPVWRNDATLWRAAWMQFPNSGSVNANLSKAFVRKKDFPAALQFAQRAVEINSNVADGHMQLGIVCLLMNNYVEATRELETAVQQDASLKYAWYNLACVYSRTQQLAKALEILQRILPADSYLAQMAGQDPEFDELRSDPAYGPRFQALLQLPNGEGTP